MEKHVLVTGLQALVLRLPRIATRGYLVNMDAVYVDARRLKRAIRRYRAERDAEASQGDAGRRIR